MATLLNKNGTSASDVLTYDKGASTVVYHAGGGNDQVSITGGKVNLELDNGNNIIVVTGGAGHVINGGIGNGSEELKIKGGSVYSAQLGSGKDTIIVSNSNGKQSNGSLSQLRAGAWGDSIIVGSGAKGYQIYGENGDDRFDLEGAEGCVLWGGAANDQFIVDRGINNKLYGGDSADYFEVIQSSADKKIEGNEFILGYGNDRITINANNNKIKANLGINDIYIHKVTGCTITADIDQAASRKKGYTEAQIKAGIGVGYGVDRVTLKNSYDVTANLGDGKDEVFVSNGVGLKLYTEGWGDTLDLSYIDSSLIDAGAGNDIIYIHNTCYTSEIFLGDGDDQYISDVGTLGATLHSKIYGGTGKDIISPGKYSQDLTIDGGAGDDTINAGQYSNLLTINGGIGNDTVILNNNKYIIAKGDAGNDRFEITGLIGYSVFDAGSGNDTIIKTGGKTETFSMAVLNLGDGDDWLEANCRNSYVLGGNGNDTFVVDGSSKDSHMHGGAGNDTFKITTNQSFFNCFYGDEGDDTFDFMNNNCTFYGGDGNDTFIARDNAGVNHLIGGSGNDTFKVSVNSCSYIDAVTGNGTLYHDSVEMINADPLKLEYIYDQDEDTLVMGFTTLKGISTVKSITFGAKDFSSKGNQTFSGIQLLNLIRNDPSVNIRPGYIGDYQDYESYESGNPLYMLEYNFEQQFPEGKEEMLKIMGNI